MADLPFSRLLGESPPQNSDSDGLNYRFTIPVDAHSFSAKAIRLDQQDKVQQLNSHRSVDLLRAFFPASQGSETPDALRLLGDEVRSGKSLDQAFAALPSHTQQELHQKAGKSLGEIISLTADDSENFWLGALHVGLRVKNSSKPENALPIFQMLSHESVPKEIREQAILEAKALRGQGGTGMRAEVLLSSFARQATDYRTIAPMIGGAFVGKAVGTFVLGRFAGGARALGVAEAFGARLTAGSVGFLAETAAFGLGSHHLSGSQNPIGDDLFRAGLSLGALRFCGFLGNQGFLRLHRFNELGVPSRLAGLAKFNQAVMPQLAIFGGMMGAHKVEEAWGLRPKVDDSTAVSDTFAAMLSMGVGSRLGRQALGRDFAKLEAEMLQRTNSATRFGAEEKLETENKTREPWGFWQPALASATGPRVFTMAMLGPKGPGNGISLTTGGGGGRSGFGEFKLGQTNSTETIRGLTHLGGEKIETLEANLKPNYEGGLSWLGAKEGLKDVLAKHNDFVLGQGTTHQDIARNLRAVLAKGIQTPEGPTRFIVHGEPFVLQSIPQQIGLEPVFQGISNSGQHYTLLNVKTGRNLHFQANQLELIEQYGFYGGEKSTHRLLPQDILAMFPHIAKRPAEVIAAEMVPVIPISGPSIPSRVIKLSRSTAPDGISGIVETSSASLRNTVSSLASVTFSPPVLRRLFDTAEEVMASNGDTPLSALMDFLKRDLEAGPVFRQLEKNYQMELAASGHQALYQELGISAEIRREVLAGFLLLASMGGQIGYDPYGFVDYLNGHREFSIDVDSVAVFFKVPFRNWSGEQLEKSPASAQQMVVQAAKSDPILMAMLTLLAARGQNWATDGVRKLERDREEELRTLAADTRHGFLGLSSPEFSRDKGDNPYHQSDTMVLGMTAASGRAAKKERVRSGNPALDPFLESIHRGDWAAIHALVDRAHSDVLAFNTLLDLAKTHEGGRWIVELALDGEKLCQQALIEAAKSEASIRSFLTYLSPQDHPWVLPFQIAEAPATEEPLSSPQVFFRHRRAKSGDAESLESMKRDSLEGFRLAQIYEKPEMYANELGDLILLASAGNKKAEKVISELWPDGQPANMRVRKGFAIASRTNYEVLAAIGAFAKLGVSWAKQTLEVYNPNMLLADLIGDRRALSGLLAMAGVGNDPARELAVKFYDLMLKTISGLRLRVNDIPTDRYLLSAMAKFSPNRLEERAIEAIKVALEHYGAEHGLRGLEGRLERGLDPAGMLAMPNTRELVGEIAHALGAKLGDVIQLTHDLHVGGIWKNAERLAAGQEPAVQTWMILAHLTAEGEKRPDEFIHDWNRLIRDLNEAATDPQPAAELARQELATRAKEKFMLMDDVPFSTHDAFLEMAISGYRFGVVQEGSDLLFVGADRLDYDILETSRLLPIEREDRGRKVTFYINEAGQDVVKRLYDGFAIVLNGDLELAKNLAKTGATAAQKTQGLSGNLAGDISLMFVAETIATMAGFESEGETRNELWSRLIQENPNQAYQLRELHHLIKTVEEAKRHSTSEMEEQMEAYFSHIENDVSRSLLATLLWRQLQAQGTVTLPLHADHEAEVILKQLGLETFARHKDADLAPETIIEKMLEEPVPDSGSRRKS